MAFAPSYYTVDSKRSFFCAYRVKVDLIELEAGPEVVLFDLCSALFTNFPLDDEVDFRIDQAKESFPRTPLRNLDYRKVLEYIEENTSSDAFTIHLKRYLSDYDTYHKKPLENVDLLNRYRITWQSDESLHHEREFFVSFDHSLPWKKPEDRRPVMTWILHDVLSSAIREIPPYASSMIRLGKDEILPTTPNLFHSDRNLIVARMLARDPSAVFHKGLQLCVSYSIEA